MEYIDARSHPERNIVDIVQRRHPGRVVAASIEQSDREMRNLKKYGPKGGNGPESPKIEKIYRNGYIMERI